MADLTNDARIVKGAAQINAERAAAAADRAAQQATKGKGK